MKVNFSLSSRPKSFEARTIWIQMGRAYLVTWTVLCFQFHTHRSLQHSKVSHYFQTVAELCLSVHDLCPSKPCPFSQIKTDMHKKKFTAWRYTFRNQGFKHYCGRCACNKLNIDAQITTPWAISKLLTWVSWNKKGLPNLPSFILQWSHK